MAENYIQSINRVWVHSNIYDFYASLNPVIEDTTLGELDKYIADLDNQIEALRRPAEAFMKAARCSDYMELSKKLFGIGESDATFDGCIKRTLSDIRFIRKVQNIKYNINDLLANSGLSEKVQPMILNATESTIYDKISATDFRKKIQKAIYEAINGKSVVDQKQILQGLFNIKESEEIKRKLVSSEGYIKRYAKDIVKKATKNLSRGQAEEIAKAFEQIFWVRYNEERIITAMSDSFLKQEVRRISNRVGEELSKTTLGELANTLGSTGEEGLSIIHEAIDSGIRITVTGTDTEEQVAKTMAKIIHNNEEAFEQYMLKGTHHSLDKYSQTDLLLTVRGCTVKAQAKNAALEALQQQLIENNWDYNKTMWYVRNMDERPLSELLQILTSGDNKHVSTLTDKDAGAIAYLLANAAWFSYAGTVSDTHNKPVSKVTTLSGLAGVYKLVNNLLAISIKDFIGMEVKKTEGDIEKGAYDSNIFFLLGNRIAFPVYLMLEEYKNQLNGIKAELFKMTYHTSPLSGIQPSTAEAYRKKILDSLNGTVPSRNRIGMDTDVGFEHGEQILNNLMGHINFNFDIAKQLGRVSYKF